MRHPNVAHVYATLMKPNLRGKGSRKIYMALERLGPTLRHSGDS